MSFEASKRERAHRGLGSGPEGHRSLDRRKRGSQEDRQYEPDEDLRDADSQEPRPGPEEERPMIGTMDTERGEASAWRGEERGGHERTGYATKESR